MNQSTATEPMLASGVRTSASRPGTALEALAVGVAVAVAYALLLPPLRAAGSAGDDGVYLALGKALASGAGYRSIYTVGLPLHVKFPPGMPALYALLWWVGGGLDQVVAGARALNCLASGTAAGLLWWLARARLSIARAPAALFVLMPLFFDSALQYAGLALSEPCFLAGWAGVLVLAARLSGAAAGATRVGLAAGLGLLLGATVLVRTQALVLIPAIILGVAIGRPGWRAALLALGCALLPVVLWLAVRPSTGGSTVLEPSYVSGLGGLGWGAIGAMIPGALAKLRLYPSIFAPFLLPFPRVGGMLIGFYLAVALFGLVRLARSQPALVLSVVATGLLILLWPYVIDRYVLSFLPVLGLAAAWWVDWELAQVPRAVRLTAATLGLLVLVAVGARQVYVRRMGEAAARADREAAFWTPSYTIPAISGYIAGASGWIMRNTAPDDHVVAAWPEGLYLRTGRLTVNLEPSELSLRAAVHGPAGRYLARAILAGGARVVVDWDTATISDRHVAAVLGSCPGSLRSAGRLGVHGYPRFYFVTGDLACLRALAAPESVRLPPARGLP